MLKLSEFIGKEIISIEIEPIDDFVFITLNDGTIFQFNGNRVYDKDGQGVIITDLPKCRK